MLHTRHLLALSSALLKFRDRAEETAAIQSHGERIPACNERVLLEEMQCFGFFFPLKDDNHCENKSTALSALSVSGL